MQMFKLFAHNRLNKLVVETFDQVELIFENYQAKIGRFVFILACSKLKLSNFSYFFHNGLKMAF
jgi:hypothetical protein